MKDWNTTAIAICYLCRGEGKTMDCSGGRYQNQDYDAKYSTCRVCQGDRVLIERTRVTTERIPKDE